MQLWGSLNILWHCLSLGLEWKLTFSSAVAIAEFSKFASILSSALWQHFKIWNSSTGIPSPPLALIIVMPPKAHLASHSRMSGSRWVITPSWLSGSWRSFLHSSVYSCQLLISSTSARSILFLSSIEPIFAWNVPLVSLIFLKRSLVLPILFFSSISLHWSLRMTFLSLLAILWNSVLRCLYLSFSPPLFTFLLSQLFVRPPQTTILPFCISFSERMKWWSHTKNNTQLWMWLVMEGRSDAVKSNIALEPGMLGPWIKPNWVVKQEMARVNINILGISQLK